MSGPDIQKMIQDIEDRTDGGAGIGQKEIELYWIAKYRTLSDLGLKEFGERHTAVMNSKYQPSWFGGVTFFTQDTHGYVYFKGREVEHYDKMMDPAKITNRLLELERRCLYLESKGEPVNTKTVVWQWENPDGWSSGLSKDIVKPLL